jgi:predicted DNA-binding transcriptional regulator AlpA
LRRDGRIPLAEELPDEEHSMALQPGRVTSKALCDAMSAAEPHPRRFIRLPEVSRLTSLATTVIYDKMKAGAFPRQIQLFSDPRAKKSAVAWDLDEIIAWQEQRLADRDHPREPGPPLPGRPLGRPRKIIVDRDEAPEPSAITARTENGSNQP